MQCIKIERRVSQKASCIHTVLARTSNSLSSPADQLSTVDWERMMIVMGRFLLLFCIKSDRHDSWSPWLIFCPWLKVFAHRCWSTFPPLATSHGEHNRTFRVPPTSLLADLYALQQGGLNPASLPACRAKKQSLHLIMKPNHISHAPLICLLSEHELAGYIGDCVGLESREVCVCVCLLGKN